METEPQDVDLGGEQPDSDDPLADVEPESVFEEEDTVLPEGVEQGSLGGVNPSEEPPPAAESPDPLAEPAPGEFLEEPEESGGDEPEPTPPEPTPEPEPEPEPEPTPEPTPEPVPEPTTQVEGTEATPEPEPEPEPKPEPAKPKPKPSGRKRGRPRKSREGKGDDTRDYVPLESAVRYTDEELSKLKQEGRVFVTHPPIKTRSGQAALRKTFHELSKGEEASFELVAVPAKLWKPKTVSGRKMDQMAIDVK